MKYNADILSFRILGYATNMQYQGVSCMRMSHVTRIRYTTRVILSHVSWRTGWRRLIGSPKLQIIFHKRATKYRALLRKMTCKDKGSYESSPPCTMLTSSALESLDMPPTCSTEAFHVYEWVTSHIDETYHVWLSHVSWRTMLTSWALESLDMPPTWSIEYAKPSSLLSCSIPSSTDRFCFVCVYVCVCVRVYACACVYMYVYIYIYIRTVYLCVCIQIYMYVFVYIYMCT